MFNNIDLSEINRNNVHKSMWVPIVAVALILFIIGLVETVLSWRSFDFFDLISAVGMLMLLGSVVWLPSGIICLIIERIAINERTTKSHIMQLLFLEALIPFLVFNGLMSNGRLDIILGTFMIAMVAQLMRWLYLSRKGRMFVKIEDSAN